VVENEPLDWPVGRNPPRRDSYFQGKLCAARRVDAADLPISPEILTTSDYAVSPPPYGRVAAPTGSQSGAMSVEGCRYRARVQAGW